MVFISCRKVLTLHENLRKALDALITLSHYLIDLDTRLTLSVNARHTPFWDVFMLLFSDKYTWAFFYVSLVWFIFRNYSWRFLIVCLLAVVVLVTLCDQLSSTWLRPMVCRLRPCDPENPLSEMVMLVNGYRPVSYSCPSTHAANTWGLTFFLSFLFRRKWLSLMLALWAFVTCWSRLYLGVHYFGDLVAGMLVGFVLALLVFYAMSGLVRLASRHQLIQTEETCLTIVPRREMWVPQAMLLATMAVLMGYSAYCNYLS